MSEKVNILIVDDDAEIRALLGRYLTEQSFVVRAAACRRELDAALSQAEPDILVLDVLLPDGSGLDICRELRAERPQLPIILLTALREEVDCIVGLELGADDYVGKPFNPRELVARIKAVLRRAGQGAQPRADFIRYRFGEFSADPQQRSVAREDGEDIELTGAEFDLLLVFLQRAGQILSRDELLSLTRGRDHEPLDRAIDVLVSRLRRKLRSANGGSLFKAVRNAGYQFAAQVSNEPAR